MAPLSGNQIKKAGSTLRKRMRGEDIPDEKVIEALDVLEMLRSEYQAPLTTANMGLRSFIRTTRCGDAQVSQRLKRMPTILDKLLREPTLSLERMHDIGGCRAVVQNMDDLTRLRHHILRQKPGSIEKDYIATPRVSGYRALHIVVTYHSRPIEIQLRTPTMHSWAQFVERHSMESGTNYKQDGESPFQEIARLAAEIMQSEEFGQPVPPDLVRRYDDLRQAFLRGDQDG